MSDSPMDSKKTPFYTMHLAAGAKMVDFAGYMMPLSYKSIMEEHRAVRERAGIFDLTHMGEFRVSGPGALDFLNRTTTNNVARLEEFQIQYSAMLYEDGGIVDDLLVYRFGDHFLMVVNAANIAKDFEWLQEHLTPEVEMEDVSDRTALLAIQGPRSQPLLEKLTDVDLAGVKYYRFIIGTVNGLEMVISRTGYTGEDGFELYMEPRHAESTWQSVMDAGKEFDAVPVGLAARDTLRLEMKFALYGNDIDAGTNPYEADLGWIVKLKKGDFIGREALIRIKKAKVHRKLVAFIMEGKAIPRQGCEIMSDSETPIGSVRSGTFSPSLKIGIGTGYIPIELATPDQEILIDIRGKQFPARIIDPPFYKKDPVE